MGERDNGSRFANFQATGRGWSGLPVSHAGNDPTWAMERVPASIVRGHGMSHDRVFRNFVAVAASFGAQHEARLKMFRPLTIAMCREAAVPETAPASGYSV